MPAGKVRVSLPQLTYGQLLQQNNTRALQITADAKEKETRALWQKEADEANAKIKAGGLPEAGFHSLSMKSMSAGGATVSWEAGFCWGSEVTGSSFLKVMAGRLFNTRPRPFKPPFTDR